MKEKKIELEWGNISQKDIDVISNDIKNAIYEKYFEVEENDIVVDFGAFVGDFTYSILNKKPQHCWVIEPVEYHFKLLYNNLNGNPVSFIRGAITDDKKINVKWADYTSESPGMTFKEFINNNCIDKIDFLKIDIEGGEYLIFTTEHLDYLKNNVKKIVVEFHLSDNIKKEKFRFFRDNILIQFKNYNINSVDGVDIKWDLFNEHFIQYYTEILIYIQN